MQESSRANSDDCKLRWMLRLGRKILVTGIVISSAPLVLPPLMAISTIGFVCSVPYGVFLVSYACAKTVMNRLLPMPSSAAPLLLEYRKAFNGEEEGNGDENQGGQNKVIKGGISMEEEEEELKEDTVAEVEMRIELVDNEKGELDKGIILQEGAYQKGGVENDEKRSMGEVNEIVEVNRCEEDVKFLDKEEELPSQSFEVEVHEIKESEAECPIIRTEQPANKRQGFDPPVERDEKRSSSNIEKEILMDAEDVKEKGELLRETRKNVENVDAQGKPKRNTKLKNERTRKGKGKQSIKESADERPEGEVHGSFTTEEGDKKKRDDVNKQTTNELKNVAVQVEKDESARESRGSLGRNRDKGTSRSAKEDKKVVGKAQVDAKVKSLKGNEGAIGTKQEQPLIEESSVEQEVDEVTGILGGLQGSKKESSVEETPLEEENVAVQLVQAIDVEEKAKLLIGARGLSKRISEDREVDDKRRAERVNIGGVGKQPKEIEVKIEGTTEVKEEQNIGSLSEQSIEEVSNIVVDFEGDKKNDSYMQKEIPFQIKKVDIQLSQSADIEEDEELVRETRGLLEKIMDEGRTDYAVDDKWSTEKEHVSREKGDKKIAEDVEKSKTRCILAHEGIEKPTRVLETKVEENKADNKVKMKEPVENLGALSKERKLGKDAEVLYEKIDVDNIPPEAQLVGPMSEAVNDGSSTKELTIESAISVEGGKVDDENESKVEQNYLKNKKKDNMIFSKEDEEQGLDLLEDLSTISQLGSPSESRPSSSYSVQQGTSDSSELPVSTKAQESDDIQTSAENSTDTASNETLNSENIWEQINALRTIVGYKAARQETCIDELKALYLFTGIEPPASFKDTSDVAEIDSKLRFLKSVVGVK
ncbi:hypothetical protein DITRI_Ditri20bG0085200 [Diplodiscus trichospermus]